MTSIRGHFLNIEAAEWMNIFFIVRLFGLSLMMVGSLMFCCVPYKRLVDFKEKLEETTGMTIRYVDLIHYALNSTNCDQIAWSSWSGCPLQQGQQIRHRQLLFAGCRKVHETISCECKDDLDEEIQKLNEHSYVDFGCVPIYDQRLRMLPVNTNFVNVTVSGARKLPGILLESCEKYSAHPSLQKIA